MKTHVLKHTLMAFTAMVFLMTLSMARADVMGFVEDVSIGGNTGVYSHTISPNGKFVFSSSISPDRLYVHKRDPETGKLTQIQVIDAGNLVPGISSSDISFGANELVVSPDGKQLYILAFLSDAAHSANDYVLGLNISDTGMLSFNGGIAETNTGTATALQIRPDGKYLYVGTGYLIAVIKRASNGNITWVETVDKDLNNNNLDNAKKITISPDGKYLYASSTSFDGHLYIYKIDQATGKLTGIQTLIEENKVSTTWEHPGDVPVKGSGGSGTAISKDGKFFYSVGGYGDDEKLRSITIFNRKADGTLSYFKSIQSPDSGNGLGILFASDIDLILSPNEKYIYTFDRIIETIAVWKRNTTTGDLSYLDRVDVSGNILSDNRIYTSKDGRNLYLNLADGSMHGIKVYDLRSDLAIVKSGPSTSVAPNGTISYTLAVTNNGPSDAYNVVATDTLPAGTTFMSGTNNNTTDPCTASGQTVTCKLGNIFNNDGYNAIIQVKAPATEGSITNNASVSADQLDTKTTNNADSVTTTIKKGGSTLPPVTGGGTSGGSGGGSMPLALLLMLVPALLRRKYA